VGTLSRLADGVGDQTVLEGDVVDRIGGSADAVDVVPGRKLDGAVVDHHLVGEVEAECIVFA